MVYSGSCCLCICVRVRGRSSVFVRDVCVGRGDRGSPNSQGYPSPSLRDQITLMLSLGVSQMSHNVFSHFVLAHMLAARNAWARQIFEFTCVPMCRKNGLNTCPNTVSPRHLASATPAHTITFAVLGQPTPHRCLYFECFQSAPYPYLK